MDGFRYYNRIWTNPQFDEDGEIIFPVSNPVGIVKSESETGHTIFSTRFFSHTKGSSGFSNILITPKGYVQRTRAGELLYTDRNTNLKRQIKFSQTMFMNFHSRDNYSFVSGMYGEILTIDNSTGMVINTIKIPIEPSETITAEIFSDNQNVYVPVSSGRIVEIGLNELLP